MERVRSCIVEKRMQGEIKKRRWKEGEGKKEEKGKGVERVFNFLSNPHFFCFIVQKFLGTCFVGGRMKEKRSGRREEKEEKGMERLSTCTLILTFLISFSEVYLDRLF